MDINCDLGEGFGAYKMAHDEKILPYVTSVNIACGFHAGDPSIMEKTVSLAIQHGVKIGAHPSYPDLQGFGRREMNVSPEEIYAMVLYQIGALHAFVRAKGGALHHVKPHGALYNQCANNERLATAVISAVKDFDPKLIIYCLSGSLMAEIATQTGLTVYHEVFADRNYNDDGTLVHRTHPYALIDGNDAMLAHVERLMDAQQIVTINGTVIGVKADTLCIHGDGEHALKFAHSIVKLRQGKS